METDIGRLERRGELRCPKEDQDASGVAQANSDQLNGARTWTTRPRVGRHQQDGTDETHKCFNFNYDNHHHHISSRSKSQGKSMSKRSLRRTHWHRIKSISNKLDCDGPKRIPTGAHLLALIIFIILLQNSTIFNKSLIQAFNIDTQSAVVHTGPEGSYFGYTVVMHRDRGVHWLLVGAPKAQTDQAKTIEAGAVYRCTPTVSKACQQIPFDPNGPSVITLGGEQNKSDDKSRQFFGASLASAYDNGSIVACAPRYVYHSTNLKRRDPVGTCWVSRGSFNGFLEYSPCRLNDKWGHNRLGSCQAGFSSAITKDGSKIFMGAPGSHVWQGQVFSHNLKSDLTNSTSWVNPHSEDDSYLGYSLATGRFSSQTGRPNTPPDAIDLAIGIPRGNDLAGKVMIVDRELRTLRNITGEQVGSYFGYTLVTMDVNGDGLDDLIIGAPLYYNATHKEPQFDRGRVYVAQQNRRHELVITQRLDGQKNRARFGTALANCGDLNRDGFQDLAVGAPYDGPDGHGAVYIYMGGRKNGLSDEFDQVIYAEQVRNEGVNLRSFGFSLSAGLDVDANQYPDLLVGDYQSDRAVLLKTRPVVNVTSSIQIQPENFNLDEKTCLLPNSNQTVSCVTVQYCTKYTGVNVDNRLGFVHDIKLDTENKGAPRMFFLNNENKNEDRNSSTLNKDTNQCKSFKAYISKQIRDKLTPLKIDIDYNLAEYPDSYDYATSQPKLKPVLNRLASGNKLSRVATIQKNCGYDNICVPDLKLSIQPNVDKYTVGSNEKIILDVAVKNNGEDAYESMFYLNMPMSINYIGINKTRSDYPVCYGAKPDQTGVNILTCDLGNPQPRNEMIRFSVITEPARGPNSSPVSTFLAQVNSTNPEPEDRRKDNEVAFDIPMRVDVRLVVSGSSQPPSIEHNSTHYQLQQALDKPVRKGLLSEADIGKEIHHNYQLQNRGPSSINDIAVTILWPTKTKDGDYLLYLVDEPETNDKVKCKPAPEGAINPEHLRYLPDSQILTQNNNNTKTQNDNINPIGPQRTSSSESRLTKRQISSTSQQEYDDNNQQSNGQAQAQAQVMAQPKTTTSVDNSILEQLNLLNCGPTQCTIFECNINDLGYNEMATIKIRSRLFEQTINKLSIQEFEISSKLVAQIKSLPYNVSATTWPPYMQKVETVVHTSGMPIFDRMPWWMILLAVLVGLLLFILLACFLKYLGFFARKRPPKGPEREPLTPTVWNDYQYTPGDTAL